MNKRSIFAILVTAGLLSSAPVGADTWEAHGNICQPDSGSGVRGMTLDTNT
jgi:hypothetical protein